MQITKPTGFFVDNPTHFVVSCEPAKRRTMLRSDPFGWASAGRVGRVGTLFFKLIDYLYLLDPWLLETIHGSSTTKHWQEPVHSQIQILALNQSDRIVTKQLYTYCSIRSGFHQISNLQSTPSRVERSPSLLFNISIPSHLLHIAWSLKCLPKKGMVQYGAENPGPVLAKRLCTLICAGSSS